MSLVLNSYIPILELKTDNHFLVRMAASYSGLSFISTKKDKF